MSYMALQKMYLFFGFSIFFLSCHRPEKMFTSLASSKTHIDFANNLEDRKGLGILSFYDELPLHDNGKIIS